MVCRHFPYRHPTFGTDKNPKSPVAWRQSVYYWWWEYLRRNDGYKRTCQQGGRGRYAKLYGDFGDVHATDFKTWWKGHGGDLFSEPLKEKQFALVEGHIDPDDFANPNLLFLQVPLNLPIRTLTQKFAAMIRNHHLGRRGIRYARDSLAKFPVSGQPNVNSLMATLKVYDCRVAHPEMKLWEVAMVLDQFKSFKPSKNPEKKREGDDEKNLMTATVSRYLRKADAMIWNVGLGNFPDTTSKRQVSVKA
jgi:hypothetical protein